MTVFSRTGLATAGFAGFVRVADLQTGTASVPRGPGVYVVVALWAGQARFLTASIGGRFKGKDPSVPVSVLSSRWHATTDVLYIGKATRAVAGRARRGGARRSAARADAARCFRAVLSAGNVAGVLPAQQLPGVRLASLRSIKRLVSTPVVLSEAQAHFLLALLAEAFPPKVRR